MHADARVCEMRDGMCGADVQWTRVGARIVGTWKDACAGARALRSADMLCSLDECTALCVERRGTLCVSGLYGTQWPGYVRWTDASSPSGGCGVFRRAGAHVMRRCVYKYFQYYVLSRVGGVNIMKGNVNMRAYAFAFDLANALRRRCAAGLALLDEGDRGKEKEGVKLPLLFSNSDAFFNHSEMPPKNTKHMHHEKTCNS